VFTHLPLTVPAGVTLHDWAALPPDVVALMEN